MTGKATLDLEDKTINAGNKHYMFSINTYSFDSTFCKNKFRIYCLNYCNVWSHIFCTWSFI